jgi:hypothetical protein
VAQKPYYATIQPRDGEPFKALIQPVEREGGGRELSPEAEEKVSQWKSQGQERAGSAKERYAGASERYQGAKEDPEAAKEAAIEKIKAAAESADHPKLDAAIERLQAAQEQGGERLQQALEKLQSVYDQLPKDYPRLEQAIAKLQALTVEDVPERRYPGRPVRGAIQSKVRGKLAERAPWEGPKRKPGGKWPPAKTDPDYGVDAEEGELPAYLDLVKSKLPEIDGNHPPEQVPPGFVWPPVGGLPAGEHAILAKIPGVGSRYLTISVPEEIPSAEGEEDSELVEEATGGEEGGEPEGGEGEQPEAPTTGQPAPRFPGAPRPAGGARASTLPAQGAAVKGQAQAAAQSAQQRAQTAQQQAAGGQRPGAHPQPGATTYPGSD